MTRQTEAVWFYGGSVGRGVATLDLNDRMQDYLFDADVPFPSGKAALDSISAGQVEFGCGCEQCAWLQQGIASHKLIIGEGLPFAPIIDGENILFTQAHIVYPEGNPRQPVGSIVLLQKKSVY